MFLTASAFLAIFAFINYILLAKCNGSMPAQPIPFEPVQYCFSFLQETFYLFAAASLSLFLAFAVLYNHELRDR